MKKRRLERDIRQARVELRKVYQKYTLLLHDVTEKVDKYLEKLEGKDGD